MPLTALALALGAAVVHAAWNLLLAREQDVEAATAVAVVTLVVVVAPAAALTWRVEREAVPYLAGSGALELAYVALLAAAYRRYDLSVVYPLARGLAPVLALVFAVALASHEPSAGEVAGVVVVAAGVLLVRGVRRTARGAGLAALIAAVIAGYTVIDGHGIRHANVAPYLVLAMSGAAVVYPATVGARRLRAALRARNVAVGAMSAAAYLLALLALRRASAPSVAAVRETSVVIAAALAAPLLGEPVGARRLAGAVAVAAGVALLALS